MRRTRSLPLVLMAVLLLAGCASAWHGVDHASLEPHQELCGLCSVSGQLGAAITPVAGFKLKLAPYGEPLLPLAAPAIMGFAASFLARGPPLILA